MANKQKAVKAYTPRGEFVGEWESVHEATRALNIPYSSKIGTCANGYDKTFATVFGYVWFRANASNEEVAERFMQLFGDNKNRYPSKQLYEHGIRFVQKDKDGKVIGLWRSIDDIMKYYDISFSTVSENVNGHSDYVRITPKSKFFKVV